MSLTFLPRRRDIVMSEKKVERSNEPQDIEDKHDVKYRNDSQGWTRGALGVPTCKNETATNYPQGNFDKKNVWRGGKL
jgi:hypothetical protein